MGKCRPRLSRTQVLSSPHVHHHVILPELLEVELVHHEEPAGNHRGSGKAEKVEGKRGTGQRSRLELLHFNAKVSSMS